MSGSGDADGNGRHTAGPDDGRIEIRIGGRELILRKRYEIASIANDLLVGIWFLIGSFLFFGEDTVTAGTWLFVIGSAELLIRPCIRLVRHIHIGRVGEVSSVTGALVDSDAEAGVADDSPQDF